MSQEFFEYNFRGAVVPAQAGQASCMLKIGSGLQNSQAYRFYRIASFDISNGALLMFATSLLRLAASLFALGPESAVSRVHVLTLSSRDRIYGGVRSCCQSNWVRFVTSAVAVIYFSPWLLCRFDLPDRAISIMSVSC
jgi:hypothetical protein